MPSATINFVPVLPPPPLPPSSLDIAIDFEFQDLFLPKRFKVYYSGRGASKSWSVTRYLIAKAHTGYIGECKTCLVWTQAQSEAYCKCKGARKILTGYRIGCFRELQTSIKDSVHRLICDQIEELGLTRWFEITDQSIRSRVTGSEFIFKGLRHNANEIKSTEGLDIAWVEEAQLVSKDSWTILIPTVRKKGSEIIVTFNPEEETDDTYQRFVVKRMPEKMALIKLVSWRNNPWFSAELEAERQHMLATDPDSYRNVWEGEPKTISAAVVFAGKYVIDSFDTPTEPNTRFFQGLDFGYAGSPFFFGRSWITGEIPNEELWVDTEIVSYKAELHEYAPLLDSCPTARSWPIKADSARPESISMLRRQGFNIVAAEKWPGSVEDGIAHLKAFKMIHIHQRCKKAAEQARLYSWKVDRITKEILPVLVDANNDFWDQLRYSLDGYIQKRGANKQWGRL